MRGHGPVHPLPTPPDRGAQPGWQVGGGGVRPFCNGSELLKKITGQSDFIQNYTCTVNLYKKVLKPRKYCIISVTRAGLR